MPADPERRGSGSFSVIAGDEHVRSQFVTYAMPGEPPEAGLPRFPERLDATSPLE